MDDGAPMTEGRAADLAATLRRLAEITGEQRMAGQVCSRLQGMVTVYGLRIAFDPAGAHCKLIEGLDGLSKWLLAHGEQLNAEGALIGAGLRGEDVGRA